MPSNAAPQQHRIGIYGFCERCGAPLWAIHSGDRPEMCDATNVIPITELIAQLRMKRLLGPDMEHLL